MFLKVARELCYILGSKVAHDTLVHRAIWFDIETITSHLVSSTVPYHVDQSSGGCYLFGAVRSGPLQGWRFYALSYAATHLLHH